MRRLRNLIDRVRDSQFFVPALFIAASLILVAGTNRFDSRTGAGVWYLMPSTVTAARTLLATIAGSIITVAALVFSFSAVTVQLAASQYSPRVVQDFLRNRVQQMVVGVVMGTFTYSLAALATLGSDPTDDARADWTASVGVGLGVLAALVIVAYIDHITRRIRIDDTITRIADETVDKFRDSSRHSTHPMNEGWNLRPETAVSVARAEEAGYVQRISLDDLLAALPEGAIARLDVRPGQYVGEGHRLVTLWRGEGQEDPDTSTIGGHVDIGGTRTIEQDPGFGIRQLVDIALRALSPGINDPATAADVVHQIVRPLRQAHLAGDVDRTHVAENGARLLAPHALNTAEYVQMALTDIQRNGAEQPLVVEALVSALSATIDELDEFGIPSPALREQLEMATEVRQAFPAEPQG